MQPLQIIVDQLLVYRTCPDGHTEFVDGAAHGNERIA
jgi:hypothetical protein